MGRPALTEEEHAQRLKMFDQRKSDAENSKTMMLSKNAINSWRKKYGVPGKNDLLNKRRDEMIAKDMTDDEIAAAEGVSVGTIRKWRWRRKIPVNHKDLRLFYAKREGKKK